MFWMRFMNGFDRDIMGKCLANGGKTVMAHGRKMLWELGSME